MDEILDKINNLGLREWLKDKETARKYAQMFKEEMKVIEESSELSTDEKTCALEYIKKEYGLCLEFS